MEDNIYCTLKTVLKISQRNCQIQHEFDIIQGKFRREQNKIPKYHAHPVSFQRKYEILPFSIRLHFPINSGSFFLNASISSLSG